MINRIKFLRNIQQLLITNGFTSENILARSSINNKLSDPENLRYIFQNRRFYAKQRSTGPPIPTDYFEDKEVQTINWDDVKNDLLTNFSRNVNRQTVDYQILIHLCSKKCWELGLKYIDILKLKNINIATQLGILNFMYAYNYVKPLDIQEKSLIINLCNEIIKEHKQLSTSVCHSCIQGFSITSEWRKCFELIDKLKEIGSPSNHLYSITVSSAFKNGYVDLGWKALQEMVDIGREPHDIVCIDWINFCIETYKDKTEMLEAIEKYLYFCSANNLKLNLNTVTYISDIFSKKLGWKSSFVDINKNGHCHHCKNSLPKVKMTNIEYIELKESLFQNVMIGKSVFAKSTPQEIDNFFTFIKLKGPFDIVIDGLNVAYSKPKTIDLKILVNVIKHFKILNKKILVISRNHMEKWQSQDMNYIKQNSTTFYTDDLSYDDTFLLYACLYYPGTKFVSRDLMRGHKFLLDNHRLQSIFKKWQVSHQYLLIYSNVKHHRVIFKVNHNQIDMTPAECLSCVSKNISWHIPYDVNCDGELRKESFEFPTEWLCLKPS